MSTSRSSGDKKLADVKWMYEGDRSTVNAEDYLTGRRIVDKHLEQYNSSDFTRDESSSKLDAVIGRKTVDRSSARDQDAHARLPSSKKHVESMLDLETVKKEDPLVAIRVKEEQIRREILENPLKMKRLQSIVMSAMRKKFNRMAKRGKEADFFAKFLHNADSASANKKSRQRSPSSSSTSSSSSNDSDSTDSDSSRQRVKIDNSRKHSETTSRDVDTPKRRRRHDSSDSDQESNHRFSKSRDYGLVYVNKPRTARQNLRASEDSSSKNDQLKDSASTNCKSEGSASKVGQNRKRQKLTEREMEEKRREMQANAEWRQERLLTNQKIYQKQARDEERREYEEKTKGAPRFIQPILHRTMQESTVSDRIKSKRQTIQRRHNDMDANFARK